ncbi:Nucleoplasmin-like domain-containing protein [Entamoeba marina]
MFWGVCIEPNGSYELNVTENIHITQACLDRELVDIKNHRVSFKIDKMECCILNFTSNCTCNKTSIFVGEGQVITILNKTQNVLYLSGYSLPNQNPELENSLVVDKQNYLRARRSEMLQRKSEAPNSRLSLPRLPSKKNEARQMNAFS